jgi:hypothetical protein
MLATMFCPNCMSPHVEPLAVEPDSEQEAEAAAEPIMRCTECEYSAPRSEFLPENYR